MNNQLPSNSFDFVKKALSRVKINHLFATSVLEKVVDGAVFVDEISKPKVYYIKHPYGMSLIFGHQGAFMEWKDFWDYLEGYSLNTGQDEWLQFWPEELAGVIGNFLEAGRYKHLELHERINFKFDQVRFSSIQTRGASVLNSEAIIRTGDKEYDALRGSVVPNYFWRSKADFLERGIGFSLMVDKAAASTAFSAFIHGNQLELGIETDELYQGRGYAFAVCCRLIDHCLKTGYEPVWSCRSGNTGSIKLASKLGFTPTLRIPYLRIKGAKSMKQAQSVTQNDGL